MEEMIINTKRGAIIFDGEKLSTPSSQLFDPKSYSCEISKNSLGRGNALIFNLNGLPVVLKHYRRGGLFGKIIKNRYRYSGIDNTRMFREFRLLEAMKEKGLPVPSPIAAQAVRYGLSYSGDLLQS